MVYGNPQIGVIPNGYPPFPGWINPAQWAALEQMVDLLQGMAVPYVISGGLAGNLHGSCWPLQDIDLDMPLAALPRVAAALPQAVVRGPGRFRDDEFAIDLLTLRLHGVEVDCCAAETVRLVGPDGSLHPCPTDLDTAVERPLAALRLRVMPLPVLIAYKRLLGRQADLADLESLALS